MHDTTSQLQGIAWMLLHCLILSIISGVTRGIAEDLSIFQIVFIYNLCGLAVLSPFAYIHRHAIKEANHVRFHIARSVIGITSMICYFYALTLIPLNEATAISFSGPLFASLAAVLFCGERMGIQRLIALILGFSGMLLILRPGSEAFQPGAVFIMAAVLLWTANTFIIKKLGRSEHNITQVFYITALSTVLALPMAALSWHPVSLEYWVLLMFIGVIYVIRTIAVFYAFKYADVTVVAPFDFSRLVFVAIIAYLFFDETLDSWTVFGSAIIVGSHVYMAHRESRKHAKQAISR